MRGRIEFKNELLNDLVIVRSDGRPTYNFVSPVDDIFDEITHVIRGEDHVSNTPTQINILRALGADLPVYAHVPNINGDDGRKLSKRHERRRARRLPRRGLPAGCALQLPRAARLELRRQDDDHVAPRARRALLARPRRAEPGDVRLQEARLDERRLPAQPAARRVRALPLQVARRAGHRLAAGRVHATVPLVQEKIEKFSQYPDFVRFLFEDVSPDGADPRDLRGGARAARRRRAVGGDAARGGAARARRRARREAADAFQPIRLAITGSKISPGLFESLELLGRERRSRACAPLAQARRPERLRRREWVERPLEAPPGFEAVVQGRARELARRVALVAGSTPTGVRGAIYHF